MTAAAFDHHHHIQAIQHIRTILYQSPVPEDAGHAENTLQWLLRLAPNASAPQRFAALAHDIERARPTRLQRHTFQDYDEFKAQHAGIGAAITERIMLDFNIERSFRKIVFELIARHEHGGDPASDLLKDADSLSYFDHNLAFYFEREGWGETLRRARWGYRRLSERARHYYTAIRPDDPGLRQLLHDATQAGPLRCPKGGH